MILETAVDRFKMITTICTYGRFATRILTHRVKAATAPGARPRDRPTAVSRMICIGRCILVSILSERMNPEFSMEVSAWIREIRLIRGLYAESGSMAPQKSQCTRPFYGEVLVNEGDRQLAGKQVQNIGTQVTEPLMVAPARL